MTAAVNLPDKQDWTVDDLASLPKDLCCRDMYAEVKVYTAAGVAHYWVIDPLFEDGMVLAQFRPDDAGQDDMAGSTNQVFTTDVPCPVTIDLPALTARRRAMIERARAGD
jgi:hypothetical protein